MSASSVQASDDAGNEPAVSSPHTPEGGTGQAAVVERSAGHATQVLPFIAHRRSRFHRQQQVSDQNGPETFHRESSERSSLTPAMRKKYLKDLLLSNSSNRGFGGVLSAFTPGPCSQDGSGTDWALYPMEHAWMLAAVDGNYGTILEFIAEDPHLLTRKDFISGYSVLHWLAKRGQDEVLIKVLRYAESEGLHVNINLRGSGGLTPLHVATMHGQYMVIKLLVGAFGANVDAMDYNGRRPWQYLQGNAPSEMKELLGTWDDEHNAGWELNVNNNSSAAAISPSPEEEESERREEDYFDRTDRRSSWRLGSFRKLLPPFSFFGHKT